MDDIKLTLKIDPKKRSPSAEAEADWIKNNQVFYALQGKPQRTRPGCWVYFIRGGQLVMRAKAKDFLRMPQGEQLSTYTGISEDKTNVWHVEVGAPVELATSSIAHKGFQGFHYVTDAEHSAFETAFALLPQTP